MAFIVNAADSTTYVYMEGMNAPSSNYKVRGARAAVPKRMTETRGMPTRFLSSPAYAARNPAPLRKTGSRTWRTSTWRWFRL